MCRSCKSDAPKWGQGIKVPVKDLPRFFESQQSWNFEQKIYGRNVEIVENVRPTLTGTLGCKDTSSTKRENQFLVREIFHCPGWRYGCSPRLGCTGKRKNCYALCKVAVYSDNPNIGVVQYAGDHGTGNPTNPIRHRPTNRIRQFIKQQHLASGATPAQLEYHIRRAAMQEGKDINDPRNVPTSAMIRHIVKRAKTGPQCGDEPYERSSTPYNRKCREQPVCNRGYLPEQINAAQELEKLKSRISDIIKPIAIKAASPVLKSEIVPPAHSGLLRSSQIPTTLQFVSLADLFRANGLLHQQKAPITDTGSVGSLSPCTPERGSPDPRWNYSTEKSTNNIWRPYLST